MAFAVSSPAKWVPPGGGQFWTSGPTADPGQILAKQLGLQSHGSAEHEGQTRCTVRWTSINVGNYTPAAPNPQAHDKDAYAGYAGYPGPRRGRSVPGQHKTKIPGNLLPLSSE